MPLPAARCERTMSRRVAAADGVGAGGACVFAEEGVAALHGDGAARLRERPDAAERSDDDVSAAELGEAGVSAERVWRGLGRTGRRQPRHLYAFGRIAHAEQLARDRGGG